MSKNTVSDFTQFLINKGLMTKKDFLDIINCKIEPKVTSQQRDLALRIAKKYCRNGKCINNEERYGCCEGCPRWNQKPCDPIPNPCLTFFCDFVLEKLNQDKKEILGLTKLEPIMKGIRNMKIKENE